MSLDLYFEEPRADAVRWRLARPGHESQFAARRLPAELRSQKISLDSLGQAGFSREVDELGESLGRCFPPELLQVLRDEPVACWIAGDAPWELAHVVGAPLAHGRSVAHPWKRAGEEVTPRPEARPRAALVGAEPLSGLEVSFAVTRHPRDDFQAVLCSEDFAVVVASGVFAPFRSAWRHYVPRLVVLHGPDPGPLVGALERLGVDALLAPRWEVPWECCAAFLDDVLAPLREGALLGEAVGNARPRHRDPWRTDVAFRLLGNPRLALADLVPARLEQARTRSAQVRPAYLLHVLEGPEAGKVIPLFAALLAAGRPLAVGGAGAHDNDIELLDESIPCRAFFLEGQEGRLLVSGPVVVNGLPVPGKLALEGGELIEVGETLLRLEACKRAGTPAAEGPRPEPLPAGSRYWLELAGSDRRFSLGRSQTLVGRAPDCDLVLEHDTVSRRHCLLVRVEGNYFLRRLGSGLTLVNGLLVEAETRLRDGDRVQLGESPEWLFLDGHKRA